MILNFSTHTLIFSKIKEIIQVDSGKVCQTPSVYFVMPFEDTLPAMTISENVHLRNGSHFHIFV